MKKSCPVVEKELAEREFETQARTDRLSDHVVGPLIGDASRCSRVGSASKLPSSLFQMSHSEIRTAVFENTR